MPREDGGRDQTHRSPHRFLITGGPTQEPLDDVRYIGNRSSGRLAVALAREAAARDHEVTLLLGPTEQELSDTAVSIQRFRTTEDLEALLATHFPACDVLIMAAAVADFRPRVRATPQSKFSREQGAFTVEFESTPDLLAKCGLNRQPHQRLIGFALEPEARLIESAQAKLDRKRVDLIVANPLETMDSAEIHATLVSRQPPIVRPLDRMSKTEFASVLLDVAESMITGR